MKLRIFLMIFVLAAFLAPAVQAVVLDSMTSGSILVADGGRWHDERTAGGTFLKDSSTFSHDGDGSMQVDYSAFTGSEYDREPRGYWNDVLLPVMPDLSDGITDTTPSSTLALSFWYHTAGSPSPERLVSVSLYSSSVEYGDGVASCEVDALWSGPPAATGWRQIILPIASFVTTQGTMNWTDVDTINFAMCCWMEAPYSPTGESVYVDDLQLIPEPATMSLLALGTLAMLKRRKA